MGRTGTDTAPVEEIRFAVVLNGGVSLAVWMGGVVVEIDRLTRADGPYAQLLTLVGATARADVIAGTSAGGINGAALALAQVNAEADLRLLRDMWAEQGDIGLLMRQPFRGSPVSLLRGDEYFLPQLRTAFQRLVSPYAPRPAGQRPVDLTITTTLLRGARTLTVDALGQQLSQSLHAGRFSFRRDTDDSVPAGESPSRDFDPDRIKDTVARLALAARCTAAFPVAFEPSFVPVGGDGTGIDELRPDMGSAASWWECGDRAPDGSRFTVDGGLLANTPTREALRAVDRMPADGPVRRVMLLVYPHAVVGAPEEPDRLTELPTLVQTSTRLLGAVSSQGSRTFVEEIDRHNRAAVSRRASRADLLATLGGADVPLAQSVHITARHLHALYRRLRIRRAARDLAGRIQPPPGWSYDRTRESAERAQSSATDLPYVPPKPAVGSAPQILEENSGWSWGVTTAEHLAESALDLLGRLGRALPADASATLYDRRSTLFQIRADLRRLRDTIDRPWRADMAAARVVPDEDYWRQRLRAYRWAMLPGSSTDGLPAEIVTALGGPAAIGEAVRAQVLRIAAVVLDVLPLLADVPSTGMRLAPWRALLTDRTTDAERAWGIGDGDGDQVTRLLARLLSLEVLTTCLAEETETGLNDPIELVQISLQADNAFARHARTPRDKGAGMALSRFAGFLKQSWRINDWIWGRLDAATTLCLVLLEPGRLRRMATEEGSLGVTEPRAIAARTVGQVMAAFGADPTDRDIRQLADAAITELEAVYQPALPAEGLPASLPTLAKLAAWAVHVPIAMEELPALARAICADRVGGANRRSRGEVFLQENEALLERLRGPLPSGDAPGGAAGGAPGGAAGGAPGGAAGGAPGGAGQSAEGPARERLERGIDALRAFDRAGIGREALVDEAASDQMIRTSVEAASVAVTVLDSSRSGLPVLKPVTRALRGAALLPYWTVRGMTGGGTIAQFLALLGLSFGGLLTILALLGALPGWASGPAAAVGAGSLLATFAYAALRTGTLLHGIVLLSPVVPLVVYALSEAGRQGAGAARGASAVILVALAVAALIVLGSLPAALPSPSTFWSRHKRRITSALVVTVALAGLAAATTLWVAPVLARWAARLGRAEAAAWLATATVAGAVVAVAAVVAWRAGRRLRLWAQDADGAWQALPVVHPAGTAAGWSVVYAVGYLAAAAVLARFAEPSPWVRAALLTATAFAAVLLLVVPWFAPWRACTQMAGRLVADATTDVYRAPVRPTAETLVERMQFVGLGYAHFLRRSGDALSLTRAGQRVVRRVDEKLTMRPTGTPPAATSPTPLPGQAMPAEVGRTPLAGAGRAVSAEPDRPAAPASGPPQRGSAADGH